MTTSQLLFEADAEVANKVAPSLSKIVDGSLGKRPPITIICSDIYFSKVYRAGDEQLLGGFFKNQPAPVVNFSLLGVLLGELPPPWAI